jgi:hypothetical protein
MLRSSRWLNSLPPEPKTRMMTVELAAAVGEVQRYTRLVNAPLTCSTLAAAAAACGKHELRGWVRTGSAWAGSGIKWRL